MVNTYAVIKDGVVENIISIDDSLVPTWFDNDSTRTLVLSDEASIGATYAGGKFTKAVDPNAYINLRKESYHYNEDQLDMIYHDKIDGTTVWEDTIAAVKAKFPKSVV